MMAVRSSFVMVPTLSSLAPEMASHFDIGARESRAMAKRHWFRRALGVGVLAGAAYAVWRAIEANRVGHEPQWEPQPFPFPPQPRTPSRDVEAAVAPTAAGNGAPWVEPTGEACPASHPIKAKLSSRIFHVPGGQSYARTVPDRCYVDRAAAEAGGFRAAKR